MAKVTVENGMIKFRKMLKTCELPAEHLVWGYLQQEDVSARMCCGSFCAEIGRVIVLDRDGKKETFQFESLKEAEELLSRIQEANPKMAVGYTKENREIFGAQAVKC